jgi:PelA/Pel-15E family pectate lyase
MEPIKTAQITPVKGQEFVPIDTDFFSEPMFYDSIHHYQMSMKPEERDYPRFRVEQVDKIAGNFILLQNEDGGWPKNVDWFKIPSGSTRQDRIQSLHRTPGAPSTLDNRNTWSQLLYLTRAYEQIPSEAFKDSFIKGLNYVIAQQNKTSGGWRGIDVEGVTFNDDVMVGVLYFLRELTENNSRLAKELDEAVRQKAHASFRDGLDCVLKTQVRDAEGALMVWGQQYDHDTLKPITARTFEPASLTALESVNVVRLLMMFDEPSTEIRDAIDSAMAWFERSKIHGVRVDTVDAPPVQFPHRFSDKDRIAVEDPNAPPIWARFYDLKTNKPIFSNRKSEILTDFNDISRERREGYNWYGYWPQALIEIHYPEWQSRNPQSSAHLRDAHAR